MEYLKQFFKRAIAKYVEVGGDDMISIGYDQGIEFRDLRLNTKAINDMLQASDAEARLEFGRIGRMNLVYTPLPGIVTIQVKDLDIRVKPNFTGLALRKLVETLYEIGDLDSSDLSPSYLQGGHCMPYGGSFPSSACGYQPGPEIHNTQARFVHPCRLPRAPPIVRRARFVKALPTAPIHFQQPVRGFSCEGAQSCMHSFAQSQDMSLERLCNDFSLLSNSLVSTCGATNARMIEKCEEVKNLFSNCVEAVAGIAPPDYDRLEKIKLPMPCAVCEAPWGACGPSLAPAKSGPCARKGSHDTNVALHCADLSTSTPEPRRPVSLCTYCKPIIFRAKQVSGELLGPPDPSKLSVLRLPPGTADTAPQWCADAQSNHRALAKDRTECSPVLLAGMAPGHIQPDTPPGSLWA
ncbi:uncharacterized protein LOC34620653 [Cyclospora cayetanensis]|uniref:Uncharacterized protein LOC34620653 n=1 Tax=Cyclospora cayetanensis TaxID=88456 RepID=A0A6P6RZ91_9EIME|nr:uncharacterized protein LOC34620653 [Cyclospora cayetanensis]